MTPDAGLLEQENMRQPARLASSRVGFVGESIFGCVVLCLLLLLLLPVSRCVVLAPVSGPCGWLRPAPCAGRPCSEAVDLILKKEKGVRMGMGMDGLESGSDPPVQVPCESHQHQRQRRGEVRHRHREEL
jgi:hypothetical protein